MDKFTFSRQQLYDLIWSKPTATLAKEFGLSDNGLRKICKKYNIPLPYLGYWAKLKYGKAVRKVKLPIKFEGKDEITISPSIETKEKNQKIFSQKSLLIKGIETTHTKLLEVPAKLTNPDELIIKAKDALTGNKYYRSDNGLISTHSGFLSIKVAPGNVSRALRFMDALIKLLKAKGYEIKVGSEESQVIINEEPLFFLLQEKLGFVDVVEGKYNRKVRNYFPSGIFTLRSWKTFRWEQKVWGDGILPIENQLAKIVAGLELLAQKERKERLEREERWRMEAEKKRIEKERHDREALDGANFLKLLEQANKWKQAQILNEFIAEIENKARLSGKLTEELKEWLKWAKEKAEEYNPLSNFRI